MAKEEVIAKTLDLYPGAVGNTYQETKKGALI
ncbi:MAG: hypothetical protein ACJAY2_002413 [Pseudomonadales bacterium]|jgi:hypothetical protein